MNVSALQLLNTLVNHPAIHDAVAPGMPMLDMSPFLMKRENVMMGNSLGVCLLDSCGHGVYLAHLLFTPYMPTKQILDICRAAMSFVFTAQNARAIVAAPPDANRGARYMARACGFAPYGHSTDSLGRPCTDYILERDTWATLQAGSSAGSALTSEPKPKPTHRSRQSRLH